MGEKVYHDMSASAQADLAAQQQAARAKATEPEGETADDDGGADDETGGQDELPGKRFISYGPDGREDEQTDDKPAAKEKSSAEEDDTGEEDDGEEDDGQQDRDPKDRPRKPKRNVQERINEMTRARRAAERERDQEREAREALEQRLARLEKAAGVADDKGGDEKPLTGKKDSDTVQSDDRPKPEDFRYGEIDPEYIEALADWKVEQRFKARDEKEQQTAEERRAAKQKEALAEKWNGHVEKGMEKYDDFEDVVIEGAKNGDYPLSNDLGAMIIESEAGADIAYHLASHPDEAESVYAMTPLEQARWFGATEARLTSEQDAPQHAPVSKAPPPVRQPRGSSGKYETPADTEDFSAFKKRAMKELNSG